MGTTELKSSSHTLLRSGNCSYLCWMELWYPLHSSVYTAIDFLTQLFKGLSYSTINTTRSALSAIVTTETDKSIGSHSKVVRFLKGVFQLGPWNSHTWNVSVWLDISESNKDLSLKQLTMKLCALLHVLATAQRVQTIHW